MSEIHYFPRYSQPENVVTNNTLLLLLRLNEYNHFKFEKFMEGLCGEQEVQLAGSLGLQFQQQKRTGKSVVDGFIAQDSIKIGVETKLTEAFDSAQLENHLALFGTEQNKLLILLSPSLGEASIQQLASVRASALTRNIQVIHTSFEDIVDKCRDCLSEHDEEMLALVNDYESFCSGMDLLPRDKYTIFAPPARLSFDANIRFRLYYCPVERSVRPHARYLGIYANRSVRAIGPILKIVACNINVDAGTVTLTEGPSLAQGEEQRILEACREARIRDWDLCTGYKFFLCDVLEETDFRKRSAGGIMGQRYIDLKAVLGRKTPIPTSMGELAALLRQHTWE